MTKLRKNIHETISTTQYDQQVKKYYPIIE